MLNHPKQKLLIIISFVLVFSSAPAFSLNINSKSTKGLAQAYGFIFSQEFYLSKIASKYPELLLDATLAKARFEATFPDMRNILERHLKNAAGNEQFDNMQSKLLEVIQQQNITRGFATRYIQKVKNRPVENIESPVLEYLLAMKYSEHPVNEFADGFRQHFRTDGTGRSQGVLLSVQAPKSWKAQTGERSSIVQKWVSENGAGNEILVLDIQDSRGYNPTNKEIEHLISTGGIKQFVPEGANHVASGKFSLDKQIVGYWLHHNWLKERAGIKMWLDYLEYRLFYQGKTIGLTCGAAGDENDRKIVQKSFEKIRPLCQQVVNSIAILQESGI